MPKTKDLSPPKKKLLPMPTGSAELLRVADSISTRATEMLDAGEIDPVEAAGHQALAVLLRMHSKGELPISFSIALLKSIAEKKTPNPVQKVETTQKVDLNVVFSGLIASSPDTLTRMIDLASMRAEGVKSRLNVKDDYLLQLPDSSQFVADSEVKAEPLEVLDIRSGGDGSLLRNNPLDSDENKEATNLYNVPAGKSFADRGKPEVER